MSMEIRVLLADDHEVVREGLAALVSYQPDMTVVGQAGDGDEVVAQYQQHRPDIVLMDLRMPKMTGVEAIAAIQKIDPESRIIVLTTYDGDEDIYRALEAGARGYLLKDASKEELLGAVRKVHEGRTHIPSEVAGRLAERTMTGPPLTPREAEVLRCIAQGKSNRGIGEALFISEGTVKTHVNSILNKLDASDRTRAVTLALKRGILQLE